MFDLIDNNILLKIMRERMKESTSLFLSQEMLRKTENKDRKITKDIKQEYERNLF